jgi:ferredoxin
MKKKLIDKKTKKRVDRKCAFCPVDDYSLLDVHRIIPGEEGGKYTDINTVTSCGNCHRKCHSGRIKILGKHPCTSGRYVLHCIIDDEEKWLET